MPSPFSNIFAIDPLDLTKVAALAEVVIFAPGDEAMAPLVLTDVTGVPLSNPIMTNEYGFGPAFIADLDQVAWSGGGLSGLMESYAGVKATAVAAQESSALSANNSEASRLASEAAAEGAAAGAADQVELELAENRAVMNQASLDVATSRDAAVAAAGLVGAPAGDAVAAAVSPGGAAHGELSATIGEQTVNFADKTISKIALGSEALESLPPNYNIGASGTVIAMGHGAMRNMTAVKKAIAIGNGSQSQGTMSRDNIGVGEDTLKNIQSASADYNQSDRSGTRCIGIGGNAGYFITSGYSHTAVGRNAGSGIVSGVGAVAIGSNALAGFAPIGFSGEIENWAPWGTEGQVLLAVGVGLSAGEKNTAASILAVGGNALRSNKKSEHNTAIGTDVFPLLDSGTGTMGGTEVALNISGTYDHTGNALTIMAVAHGMASGDVAFIRLLDGGSQTFLSDIARAFVTSVPDADHFVVTHPITRTASGASVVLGRETAAQAARNGSNTGAGSNAGAKLITGSENAFYGADAMGTATTAARTTAVGKQALARAKTSAASTVVGYYAGGFIDAAATEVSALGANALRVKIDGTSMTESWNNITAIGYDSRVSAPHQVQLGDSRTTTYVYGTVQNRSDERDKTDIQDTVLGLDFINKLRPVDYRWDMRDDYTVVHEDGTFTTLPHDGSKARTRHHHGFIAQDVQALIAETGIDFGGFQDHSKNGGSEVLSVGYDEFIAPIIKSIQELTAQITLMKEAA